MRRPLANNQIRASRVRVLDETGKQLGIMPLTEALRKARERNLDLVQITEKVDPPVCKITDFGKHLYSHEKKERKTKVKKGGEMKGIRLGFNISLHDLETRANLAEKFLKRGDRVRVEMILRGRQRALFDFAKQKVQQFTEILEKLIPIKIEKNLERRGNRLIMIISKKQ